ncbi:MAG TPA: amino acid adenylation domain-containing protein, partial [Thermoanaerobaculia bacterium]|nr:amino acid adenylation domain-containing protein [Thermoanaerobaculia bacterium]
HEVFADHAARAPDRVAVTCEGRAITYGALAAASSRLARRLAREGVAPGVLVALCVERSPELVVAVLGILRAGGAYVPLDPAAPEERLRFLVADSGAPVVVTVAGLAGAVPAGARRVCLDTEAEALAAEPAAAPAVAVAPDELAYVIYTSGSTGRPKGSLVSHANVQRLLAATEAWFGFTAGDVWTLFHSYAFDFSVWELWGALAYGGRLVVVPYWVSRAPEAFRELLARERVTVLNQTPSAFRQLAAADEAAGAPAGELALRTVIFGGEALEPASLAPWLERHGDERPRLVNMYGITETTVHVSYRPVAAADLAGGAASPVGVPIPDLQIHLLDPWMNLVPAGVPGEIHVGGAGLARGYHGRPALTAERFVPDPFAAGDGGRRLYRSGDLARRLPDGGLDFLGRIDQQVKIRGFRIELGEIEAVLSHHPAVGQVAVVAREGAAPGDLRLVAYVVPAPGTTPRLGELREHAGRSLPDYMVPAAFVLLDALPLTVNGKLDRRALPAPEETDRLGSEAAGEPPATPTEELLAGLWARLLGVERVSRSDDFFELGGHSLLATRVASRTRELLGVEAPLRELFENPTLAAMAAAFDRARRSGAGEGPPPLAPLPREGEAPWALPLSFAQERLWFLDRLHPGSAAYNIPAAVRLEGELDAGALVAALQGVVRRHETLRTRFGAAGGAPVQWVAAAGALPVERVDLSALAPETREERARALVRERARRPFDLAAGPLARALLVTLGPREHLLALTVHHIVSDGWSMGVLVREVAALYAAAAAGREPALE